MATSVIDTFITEYKMDASGYVAASRTVSSHTLKLADDNNKASGSLKGLSGAFDGLKNGISTAMPILTAYFGILAGITGAFVAAGSYASQAAAKYEGLTKSLESVVGGASAAQKALNALREAAKAPGLGFPEAVKGFTQLVNSGQSQKFALDIVKEVANANARAGGNKETFSRAMLAMSQIGNSDFLQGDELNQLAEAGIPGRKYIKEKYGTADTEKLKSQGVTSQMVLATLVEQMSKLERAGGGVGTAFENLGDAFEYMAATAGKVINEKLLPIVESMAAALETIADSGAIATFTEQIVGMFDGLNGNASEVRSIFLDVMEVALTMAFAIQNVVLNLQDMFNWLKVLVGGLVGSAMIKKAEESDISPQNLAHQVRETWEQQIQNTGEGFDSANKPGTKVKMVRNSKGAWVKKGGPNDDTGGDLPGDAKKKEQEPAEKEATERIAEYTKQTAQHTKTMANNLADAILGGGIIGSKGITHRELSRFVNNAIDMNLAER